MWQPSVSVIISSYNYGHFLGATIESVLTQTYPAREVIIIDDGSTDNSAEVAGSFGGRVKFIAQKIRVFASRATMGRNSRAETFWPSSIPTIFGCHAN